MTAKELHVQKIIPLRMELERLEKEYKELYRKECGEKIGEKASCDNCVFSCIIDVQTHNHCMNGKCTCCNSWCYNWTPENEVSKFLRENYHWETSMYYRLQDIFGNYFLTKCDNSESAAIVMKMLELVAKFDGKVDNWQ